MEKLLTQITSTIQNYRNLRDKLDFNQCDTLVNIMKCLSSDLFFLENHLDNERQKYYESVVLLLKTYSATEAEKRAKNLHPEKRMLERFTTSAYKVLDSVRSHLSYLKNEKT